MLPSPERKRAGQPTRYFHSSARSHLGMGDSREFEKCFRAPSVSEWVSQRDIFAAPHGRGSDKSPNAYVPGITIWNGPNFPNAKVNTLFPGVFPSVRSISRMLGKNTVGASAMVPPPVATLWNAKVALS